MSSSFAGMPRVHTAGPKEKTFFAIADFLDDFCFHRQMHCAYGFLADRRGGAFERGGCVLQDISLARLRISPAFRANAMNDSQELLAAFNLRTRLFRRHHDSL